MDSPQQQQPEMTKLSDLGLDLPLPEAPPPKPQPPPQQQQKRVTFSDVDDVQYFDEDEEDGYYVRTNSEPTSSSGSGLLQKPLWTVQVVDGISLLAGTAAAWYSARIPVLGGMISEVSLVTKIVVFTLLFRIMFALVTSLLNRSKSRRSSSRRRRR